MRVEFTDESILHHAFLQFDISLIKHLLKNIFVSAIDFGFTIFLHLMIANADDRFKEHRVVQTILDIQWILNRQSDQLVQGLEDTKGFIVSRCQFHHLHKVKKTLDWNHVVLFLSEYLGMQRAVELKVIA